MRTLNEQKAIPCLDYKSHDSAWYEAAVVLQDDNLRIRFEGGVVEETLSLQKVEDFEELKTKFRYPSIRLEDKQCRKALPGTNVCAFHSDADTRYFDARVENVSWSRHMIVNREEQCMCTYEVLWLAGPYEGKKTTIHCENIRLRWYRSIQSHPIIKYVLNYLQKKGKCKSQSAAEISLQEKILHFIDNTKKPFKPRADDFLEEKVQKSISGGNKCWIDVEDELGDLNLTPAAGNEDETSLEEKIVHFRDNIHKPFKPRADDFLAEKVRKSIHGGDKYWIDVEDGLIDLNLKPAAAGNEGERIHNLETEPNKTSEVDNRKKVELTRKRCYDGITECDAKKFRYENSSEHCERLSEVTKVDYNIGFESSASAWKETKRLEDRTMLDLNRCSDEIIEVDVEVGYDNSSEHSEPQSQFTKVDYIVAFEPSAPPWKGMRQVEKSVNQKLDVKNSILSSKEIFHLHGTGDVSNEVYADGNLSFAKQENIDTLAASCKVESFDSEKGTLSCLGHVIENPKDENLLKRPSECSGGLLDCVSSRTGQDCSQDILGKSDNVFDCDPGYFSVGGHANCVNEWKGFPEDCLRGIDDNNKILSPMMINDAKQEVRSKENVRLKKEKIWDAVQNRAITTACNIYSQCRNRQPKVTNNKIPRRDNYIQNFGPQKRDEPNNQRKSFPSAHILVLENLGKDVTPSDVLSVICHAGGDAAKVYITPTQLSEKFKRGFVCFQDEANFQRVSAFLRNENILIASSDGRPWVVIDEGNGLSQSYFADLTSGSELLSLVV